MSLDIDEGRIILRTVFEKQLDGDAAEQARFKRSQKPQTEWTEECQMIAIEGDSVCIRSERRPLEKCPRRSTVPRLLAMPTSGDSRCGRVESIPCRPRNAGWFGFRSDNQRGGAAPTITIGSGNSMDPHLSASACSSGALYAPPSGKVARKSTHRLSIIVTS
jgi:hypothetical protein